MLCTCVRFQGNSESHTSEGRKETKTNPRPGRASQTHRNICVSILVLKRFASIAWPRTGFLMVFPKHKKTRKIRIQYDEKDKRTASQVSIHDKFNKKGYEQCTEFSSLYSYQLVISYRHITPRDGPLIATNHNRRATSSSWGCYLLFALCSVSFCNLFLSFIIRAHLETRQPVFPRNSLTPVKGKWGVVLPRWRKRQGRWGKKYTTRKSSSASPTGGRAHLGRNSSSAAPRHKLLNPTPLQNGHTPHVSALSVSLHISSICPPWLSQINERKLEVSNIDTRAHFHG